MLKKTMTYTDYDGNERTEDFLFNLTEAECLELEMSTDGGMEQMLRRIIAAQDMPTIIETFKNIILHAYGEKSPDGKRFVKINDAGVPVSRAFSQTQAYSDLFLELSTNAELAAKFINDTVSANKKSASIPASTNAASITNITNINQ